mmetsp:Transcript_20421/g.66855  ORF Transcript_20421/g.66855 Transcript_20421/m.66855 type:complete len:203 (-) Transcript_20421:788-1396(-)
MSVTSKAEANAFAPSSLTSLDPRFNELSAGALRSTRGQQVNASTSALKASARIRADHFCVRAQHRYRGRRGDWRGPQAQLRLKRAPGSEHQPQRGLGRGAEGGLGFVVEAVVLEIQQGQDRVHLQSGGQRLRALVADPIAVEVQRGQHRVAAQRLGDRSGALVADPVEIEPQLGQYRTLLTSRAEASAVAPSLPMLLPTRFR